MSQDQSQTNTADEKPTTAEAAKEAAAELAGTTPETASTAEQPETPDATDTGSQDEAEETTGDGEDDAQQQPAGGGKQRVVDGLRAAGDRVRSLADGDGVVGDLAGKASQGIKQASEWVADRDPQAMLTEAKSFARRKPWVTAGVAAVALMLANKATRAFTGGSKR